MKDLCRTEMLARTCKNIINGKLSELIMETKIEYRYLLDQKKKEDQIQKHQDQPSSKLRKEHTNSKLSIEAGLFTA